VQAFVSAPKVLDRELSTLILCGHGKTASGESDLYDLADGEHRGNRVVNIDVGLDALHGIQCMARPRRACILDRAGVSGGYAGNGLRW